MSQDRTPGLISIFIDTYRENVTGNNGDQLMTFAARSMTIAGSSLVVAALAAAANRPEIALGALVVTFLSNTALRVATRASIERSGDPPGFFRRS